MITKQVVADRIGAWLHHEISLDCLVNWAEEAIQEGQFTEADGAELLSLIHI